jgi:hypothetical protein
METTLRVDIQPQPDDFTCGPTCLHALYRYFGDDLPLEQVVAEVPMLDSGGTLDVLLAIHALKRGYSARIFTYNVELFDPTWFDGALVDLRERLRAQMDHKPNPRLRLATQAYLEFLDRGGQLRFEDLTTALVRRYLYRKTPILTGLSATWLYREMRETAPEGRADDLRGKPSGHFVVLCGYDRETREVLVADPLHRNPLSGAHTYKVEIDRVICAILLGIVTYDANLLVIEPGLTSRRGPRADSHRR